MYLNQAGDEPHGIYSSSSSSSSRQDLCVLQSQDGGEQGIRPSHAYRHYSTLKPLDWSGKEQDPIWALLGVCGKRISPCLSCPVIIPPPPTASSWHMKLLWIPPSMPQGCAHVDGNTSLGCLHQYKLQVPCQQVEKTLKHPACPASSPSQPWAMVYRRTTSGATCVCI